MDARTGINFLRLLLTQGLMDDADLEEAIRIAGEKSPTGSFKAGQLYFIGKHGMNTSDGYLAFAKGTRWLAVLRRDDGQKTYDGAVEDLRTFANITTPTV